MKTTLLKKIKKRFLYKIKVIRDSQNNKILNVRVDFIDTRSKKVYVDESLKSFIEKTINLIYGRNLAYSESKYEELLYKRRYNRAFKTFKQN